MALCFPSTLTTTERHKSLLAFNAVENTDRFTNREGVFGIVKTAKQSNLGSVYLYMPALGDVTYAQQFDNHTPSLIEKIAGIVMRNSNDGDINFGDIAKEGAAAIGSSIGSTLRDMVSTDISNPHTTVKYSGPVLRTQQFSFDLYPRDLSELRTVSNIIKFFKIHASPQLGETGASGTSGGSGLIDYAKTAIAADRLKYPAIWTIEEIPSSSSNKVLLPFKFGPAYLRQVSVGYHNIMFNTGDPVHITLTLDFMESQMLTKAEIGNGF